LWKQQSFVVLRSLRIEFFRNLLELNASTVLPVAQSCSVPYRNFQIPDLIRDLTCTKNRDGTVRALSRFVISKNWEEVILKVNIDNIGELAIVECEGRIVQSEAAFKTLSHLKAMLVRWFLK
jgi:hypothetical protein